MSDDRCPLCGGSIRHPMCPAIEHGREVPWTIALLAGGMIVLLMLSVFGPPTYITLIVATVLTVIVVAVAGWVARGLWN